MYKNIDIDIDWEDIKQYITKEASSSQLEKIEALVTKERGSVALLLPQGFPLHTMIKNWTLDKTLKLEYFLKHIDDITLEELEKDV